MTALARDLWLWFWRLVPANPILVRVVLAGGRRSKHAVARGLYLAALVVISVIGVVGVQTGAATSLADFAKAATHVFKATATAQLLLVCIAAPMFTAAAINQERDSQTYSILLATPLSSAQIVFGTLLSRLYFVFVLLLAGLPLFIIMMVYGGVTLREITVSAGLAASTALICGALAIAMAVVRVGTRRTVFSFYFVIALYLMAVFSLSRLGGFIPPESEPAPGGDTSMSWLAAFHPFLALRVVMGETPAPPIGAVAHYGKMAAWLLAYPAMAYIAMTTLLSVLLCTASIAFVRASIKEGEPTWYNRFFGRRAPADNTDDGVRTRRIRHVWENPGGYFSSLAWREAATRASGGGRTVQRILVIVAGVMAAGVLLYFYAVGLSPAMTRQWLAVVIAIEVGLGLLVATNTAATALTREKESGTLDLLLVTPLVSRDILWGKICGMILFAIPMIAVPFLSLALFVLYDAATGRTWKAGPIVHVEVLASMPVMLIAFAALACMIGMKQSVDQKKTVTAVIYSIVWLVGICGVTAGIAIIMSSASPILGAVAMPFSPVPAALVAIDGPGWLGGGVTQAIAEQHRGIIFIASIASALGYAFVSAQFHRAIVTGFDMTIRKQTA